MENFKKKVMEEKLKELAVKCSAITKEKGFFNVWQGNEIGLLKHNVLQQYGELAEAYEAKRKGKFYSGEFKKDTFEDELADVCIFGLSCLGAFGFELSFYSDIKEYEIIYEDFTDFYLFMIQNDAFNGVSKVSLTAKIEDILYMLIAWCENNNIDIFMHIDQKMKYNASREKLHGKKF